MEAKYLEITLVMHFKCYIGGKGENLKSFCPPKLLYALLRFAVEVQVFHCVQIPLQFHCIFYRQTMQILNVKTAKTYLQWVVCKKCSETAVGFVMQWKPSFCSENISSVVKIFKLGKRRSILQGLIKGPFGPKSGMLITTPRKVWCIWQKIKGWSHHIFAEWPSAPSNWHCKSTVELGFKNFFGHSHFGS